MNSSEPTIKKCYIGPYPRLMPEGMKDELPKVKVQFDNGEEKTLFEFYPDELSFSEQEFIGLNENEALNLKFEKDRNYIQS